MTPNPTKERQKVEQIVASLSEAQKAILLDEPWYATRGGWKLKRSRSWSYTLGITIPGSSYLTPLGQAVRSFIQENGK